MQFKALVLGIILSLVGIASAQTEVIFWDFLGGGDGVRMAALVEDFNASHDDIQINRTTLEWGVPFYTKIQTSAAVGEGPDLMTYHLSRFPLGVDQNVLRPLSDEELSVAGIATDVFQPGLIDSATIGGELYGIPFDVHALVLYYNRDILEPLGMIGDDGLPTGFDGIDNFNESLERIAASGTTPMCLSASADDSATVYRVFYSLLNQLGGSIFTDDGQVDTGEAGLRAVQTMADWMENGYSSKNLTYQAMVAGFAGGECALMFNGVWEVPTMVDLAEQGELFDWGAIAPPTLFGQAAGWADSHAFAIPQEPDAMSAEKLGAALEVIRWMNENSLFWATAGHIPAYVPVTESAEYQEMEPNATYAVLTESAVYDPQSVLAGVAGPIYDANANYIMPAVNGQLPVDQALEMFHQELQGQIR